MDRRKIAQSLEQELRALEEYLAGNLKPVSPPGEIVRRLRGRIRLPQREEVASRLRDWQTLLLVFGGVLSGMLILITVGRALFHLFARKQGG